MKPADVSLDDRTGVTEDDRQAEAAALTAKLVTTGAFRDDEDGSHVRQAKWMVYQALIVEDMCQIPGIEALVSGTEQVDRDELLHEAMLHFNEIDAAPWNIALVLEIEMKAYTPTPGKPASVYEGVRLAMARFRAAAGNGEVLGSWLEVWSSIANLIGELLSLMATGAGR